MFKKLYYAMHDAFSKPEQRGEYSAGAWQEMVRERVLAQTEGMSGSLLELGCGEGLFLTALREKNKQVFLFGIDIWETILDRARERCREKGITDISLRQADAKKLPFENAWFDATVCMNVLFNLPDEAAAHAVIAEMSRVTKLGGTAIFDIRNAGNPLLALKYALAPLYDATVKDLPLKTYHLSRILCAAKDAGFEIVSVEPVGLPMKALAPLLVITGKKVR
jgi:ubiquinone/menaquinone biosynthesis C-methylase UbiE